MIKRISDWLEDRTGYKKLVAALLIEHIPGGAKWRYVWGSCLVFVFMLQLVTGVLLMTSYSPGDSTAWSSVYFIQYEMDFGWLIRGLHHFGSQTMVILLALHMLQVVIAGAHLPPREVNWWLGMVLLGLVLALSLTGYLLPWDQKGYWATKVSTNIAGNLPVVGPWLSKIIVGGPEYGHHTLTRFYTLHVGILPPLVVVLVIAHMAVFRRHGVTHGLPADPADPEGRPHTSPRDGWFWPDQAFRDLLVCLVIFGIMLGVVLYGHGQPLDAATADPANDRQSLYAKWAHAGRQGMGANLDAPADPGTESYPARPEWYFLFLFQLLKYFEGEQELLGTVIIPNGVMLLLLILPLLAMGQRQGGVFRRFAHIAGVVVVGGLLIAAGGLTYIALAADQSDSKFQAGLREAEKLAHRSVNLAHEGVPAEGGAQLLRRDPQTQGPRLFRQYCASCHTYGNMFENQDKATASDLQGFGSKDWISGLLADPDNPRYFGRTKLKRMKEWVKRERTRAEKNVKVREELETDFTQIADWLSRHPAEPVPEENNQSPFAIGYRAFEKRCGQCHTYRSEPEGESKAPDMTSYGSADWLRLMIMSPEHGTRYGRANRMPIFRDLEGPTAELVRQEVRRSKQLLLAGAKEGDESAAKAIDEATRLVHLSDVEREIIIRWLLNDGRVVFGGSPLAAPPGR